MSLIKAHKATDGITIRLMRENNLSGLIKEASDRAIVSGHTMFIFETPHAHFIVRDDDLTGLTSADSHNYPLTVIVTPSGAILQVLDDGLIGIVDNFGLNPKEGII